MASPLNWFRRNAIFIMVPVGIFCMAFFGLGAVFEQFATDLRSGGSRANPVIATWKKGEFTRDRINELAQNHFALRRTLNAIEEFGKSQEGDEFVSLVAPIAPIRDGQQDYINEQVISRFLMAEKAKEEGLLVSQSMIDDYLALAAGGGGISNRQIKEINREANGGRIPLAAVRRQLEIELLNQKMMLLTYSGVPRVPNITESIEHFGKTARKVSCEVIPVSVEKFVDDSATPTQSEIRKLYEEGKYEFKDPTSERPGFKLPRRIKLQYFAGTYDSFLTKVSADLTDKEIQEAYDELVRQESELVMEIVPDDSQEPAEVDSADEAEDSESDPAPAPSTSEDKSKPKTSYNIAPSKFQFVSTAVEDESDAEVSAETESTESTDSAEAEAEAEAPAETEAGGLEAMLNAADNDADGIGPLLGDNDDRIVKRAKPLKEVEGLIRRQLKGAEATQAFREALQTAESAVENYNLQLLQWDEGRNTDDPKPEAPDFQAIADANGLRLAETELVDNAALNQTEVGRTLKFNPAARNVDRLGDLIFDRFPSLDLYSANVFSDNTKAFVFWPVALEDTEAAELQECKEDVIKFWRRQRAFAAAKAAAEKIAAEAGPEMKLTQIDPDKAAPTGEFTWFEPRGRRAVYSSPIGVVVPGEEFMKAAFSLKQGQATVAANRRRDTIYVIQATQEAATVDQYGDEYLQEQFFKFQRIPADVGLVNGHYFQEKQMDWNREYVDSMDFDFIK